MLHKKAIQKDPLSFKAEGWVWQKYLFISSHSSNYNREIALFYSRKYVALKY